MARRLQTKYELVSTDEWKQTTASLRLASESLRVAKNRYAIAAEQAKKLLEGAEKVAVQCENFKFSYKEQAGRTSFDEERFAKDHPGIDLNKYKSKGPDVKVFRVSGPKDQKREGFEDQLVTLHDKLVAFTTDASGGEVALDKFDELRNETELYIRALDNESNQIGKALKTAHAALVKRVTEMSLPESQTVSED